MDTLKSPPPPPLVLLVTGSSPDPLQRFSFQSPQVLQVMPRSPALHPTLEGCPRRMGRPVPGKVKTDERSSNYFYMQYEERAKFRLIILRVINARIKKMAAFYTWLGL